MLCQDTLVMGGSQRGGVLLSTTLGLVLFFGIVHPAAPAAESLTRPVAMWPLCNDTLGYNVLLDERGHLEGGAFMDGPFPGHRAIKLDGKSYVDAVLENQLSGPIVFDTTWSLVMFLYVENASSGTLYEYVNKSNTSIFKVQLTNGLLNIDFSGSQSTRTSVIPTRKWFQLSIVRDDQELEIDTETASLLNRRVHFSTGSLLSPGVLRVGRGFQNGDPGFYGGIWCLRYYKDDLERDDLDSKSADHCFKDLTWKYKGPYGCMFYPCENGAHCTDNKTVNYDCDCVSGYTGRNCETDIDECVGVVCENGGTCEDALDSYRCRCRADFRGDHCETVIEKDNDAGYFVLRARDSRPLDASAMTSIFVTSASQCGSHCVRVPGCLSFATSAAGDLASECVLYPDVLNPVNYSTSSNYYVPRV